MDAPAVYETPIVLASFDADEILAEAEAAVSSSVTLVSSL
jgi:hypothetical protein